MSILDHMSTALFNLRSNRQVTLVSIATFAIAFSLLGLFLLLFVNLESFLKIWSKKVELVVYLEREITENQQLDIQHLIQENPHVESHKFVSSELAWNNFKDSFSGEYDFLETLDFNPLPASFNIQFRQSEHRVDHIRQFAEMLRKQPGVESLEFGEQWIVRFEKFLVFLRLFFIVVGLLLSVGLVFIISNTIRLSIHNRQDEIEMMLLVGATHRYIRAPYMLEGILQGIIGVVLALAVIKGMHVFMKFQFEDKLKLLLGDGELLFMSPNYVLLMFAVGVAVGWVGSLLSLNQVFIPEKR